MKDGSAIARALLAPAVTVPHGLERHEELPAAPGFYAWWSRRDAIRGLPHVPHPADDNLSLLYVGISPVRESSRPPDSNCGPRYEDVEPSSACLVVHPEP